MGSAEFLKGLVQPQRDIRRFVPLPDGATLRKDSRVAPKYLPERRGHVNNNLGLPRRGTLYTREDIARELSEPSDKSLQQQLEERVSKRQHRTSSNWLTQLSEEELRDGPLPFGIHEEGDEERGIDVEGPPEWEFFEDTTLR